MCISAIKNIEQNESVLPQNFVNEISDGNNLEAPNTLAYPIAFGSGALKKSLTRGTYKVKGEIENKSLKGFDIFDRQIEIPTETGKKRVFIHSLNVSDAEKISEGRFGSKFEMVYTVIDNPIPIAFIIYGLGAIGTLSAGYFFVDRLDKFTSSTAGTLVTIGLAGISAFIAIKNL